MSDSDSLSVTETVKKSAIECCFLQAGSILALRLDVVLYVLIAVS